MPSSPPNIPRIAALPMYDFPELQGAHDAFWSAIAGRLVERGIANVPRQLARDLEYGDPEPSIAGRLRGAWRDPSLLLGQACEYPIAKSFGSFLTLVATPRYSAPGCDGALYRSAIVVRADDPAVTPAECRGRRCIVNELDSNSGMNLLRAAVAPLAGGKRFFQSVRISGSHRRSVQSVGAGEADIAAIDCVTFAHLRRLHAEETSRVRILCWSPASPSLPFVTAHRTDERTLEALRASLADTIADPALRSVRELLWLEGIEPRPDAGLSRVLELERHASELCYPLLG